MIYVLQLCLFCGFFTALVAVGTGGKAINGIYFYPKPVLELGLTTYEAIKRKSRRFMIPFLFILLGTLLLIIGLRNHAADIESAYWQSFLFPRAMRKIAMLAWIFDECREGKRPVGANTPQLCCASSLIPRQLAAGYLIS